MDKPMDQSYKLFINGEWVEAKRGKAFKTHSPIDGQLLTTCADAGEEDVECAVQAAWKAYESWKDMGCDERAAVIMKFADKLEENIQHLALTETMDTGKALRETSFAEIPNGIQQFRYYASAIKSMKDEMKVVDKNTMALIMREPLGVVGQITGWNFPYFLAMQKIAPALAAGNTIVIKPSSETPLSLLEFAKLTVGILPPGVVNVITGKGSTTGQYMIDNGGFKKLDFTGSTEVGYTVAEAAAKKLIPATLELGGKSANIVFPDCNWAKAIEGVKLGIIYSQGQVCCAGSRVFVHEDIYDKFLEQCVKEFNQVRVGNPLVMENQVGSIATEAQMKKVMEYIELGQKEGARLACGGYQVMDEGLEKGFFFKPTILAEVDNKSTVAQEEIFGPVACFIKFKDEADVISMANDSQFGLAGGVWTKDINKALRVSRSVETGLMFVNCYNELSTGTPFGGYKKSGYGRINDIMAIDGYSQIKTVRISMNEELAGWFNF